MRTILITGTSRDMGLEIARQVLNAEPATRLVLTSRKQEDFEKIKAYLTQQLNNHNLSLVFVVLDLLNKDTVQAAVDQIKSQDILIDILVNNASVLSQKEYPGVAKDTITANYVYTRLFTDMLLHNGLFNNNLRIINVSAMLGNIRAVKDDDLRQEFRNSSIESLDALAQKWIKLMDEEHKTTEVTDDYFSMYPAYAISKLLFTLYTNKLKNDKEVIARGGIVVALHPGVVKNEHNPHLPLSVEEGATPTFEFITMDDEKFKSFNGEFVDRHLKPVNILDESIDFRQIAL